MTPQTFEALEYESLKELLAGRTQTPMGKTLALGLQPSTEYNQIVRGLKLTGDCVKYFQRHSGLGLGGLTDPAQMLAWLKIEGSRLEALQILEMIGLIEVAQSLRASFMGLRNEYPQLSMLVGELPDLKHVLRSIKGKILPNGEIDDHASPQLAEIRHQMHKVRARIYRQLEAIMQRSQEGMVQDEIVTIRNERFVIPIRATHRGQIPGVVHAASSSGATVFVEPLETIELNNERVRLTELEQAEIVRILLELTDRLRVELPQLEKLTRLVAEVDLIAAKARLAVEFDCAEPQIERSGYKIVLTNARHLILENILKRRNERPVPISVELDGEHPVMIISGPNAGGKTVALKTVGLAVLMAQSGMHVPATDARLSIFNQVLADIGDHQSIVANLSTFTAHIKCVREMTETLKPPALALMDEAGTGTDPEEGAALAVAMVDFFKRKGAMVIAATHYTPLKMYGYLTPGVVNASVEFDEAKLQPTYRLIQGIAGSSSGIEIARRVGLREEILADAKRQVSESNQEATRYLTRLKTELDSQQALRAALEEERAIVAERFQKLDEQFKRRETERQKKFESELKQLVETLTSRTDELINQIADRKAQHEARKLADRRLAAVKTELREQSKQVSFDVPPRGESIKSIPAEAAILKIGARVRLRDIDKSAEVVNIERDQITVQVGLLRMKTDVGNLDLILEPSKSEARTEQEPTAAESGVVVELTSRRQISSELNLLGRTVEEALELTDQFLDDAFLASLDSVRIIHGAGTGALRKAIRTMLERHPHVASFRPGAPSEGADGATVVELRRR
jgi:DNA mismatch repair protein MutS2